MSGNDHISALFNHNGCLKQSAIVKYIDGKLGEKELEAVLSHLETCPLCKDAVEGISGTGTDQFRKDMDQLRAQFHVTRLGKKDKKNRLFMISAISAAASIIIIIGVLFFYKQTRLNMKSNIAQTINANDEVKEKATAREKPVPPDKATLTARSEKEENRITKAKVTEENQINKSVSADVKPLSDFDEDKVMASESMQDSVLIKDGLSVSEEQSKYNLTKKATESSEQQSVAFDMLSGAAITRGKSSRSAINTGLIQEKAEPEAVMTIPVKHDVFLTGERLTFKGGDINAFVNYIQDQINIRDKLNIKTNADSIIVSFMVDTLGRPANIKIINPVDPEINREIIRVFESSPAWIPGKENGIMVNTKYTISLRMLPEKSE